MYQKYVKRFIDIVCSAAFLVVFSWLYLILAILVKVKLGTPVIFKQDRTGYHNQIFTMYKFRSMTSELDENGELLPDAQRLTRFGKFLRATSMDELPEVMNIFKGDMSFVGPRPLLPNYVDLYSPRQRRRHEVKPGLTGLAQVNGRNAIEWEEKFEFDLEYSDNISFILDVEIFLQTVFKVARRSGINAGDGVTMESFHGTRRQRFGNKHEQVLKVLFTNPGNKVELVQTFLYAAGNLGIQLDTYGADVSIGLPAMLICQNKRRCKSPKEAGYVQQILEICQKDQIDLVVPLSEDERVLAGYHEEFKRVGTKLLISSEEVANLCMDKRRVIDYFASCKLHNTRTVDNLADYQGGYPAAVELKDETRGVYSYRVENEKEMQYYIMRFENYLIRPYIEGTEYEVDVFCDFDGKPIYITPKKREVMQEKEIARYRVEQDAMMILEVKSILDSLRPVGPLTIGIVKEDKTGYNYFVGMRPIFSMNATISIKAGADSPLAALKLMYGSRLTFQEGAADDGVMFSRIEQTVEIKPEFGKIHKFRKFDELYDIGDEIEAVVFELDDVLYSQKDYMRSGLKVVAEKLPQIHNCYNRMCVALEKGLMPIETVLREERMSTDEYLRQYLDIYIEHEPKIALYPGVADLFKELRKKKCYLAVITDGKLTMQKNKVKVLNLRSLVDEIIYTDELAGNGDVHEFRKPNDIAYLIMKKRLGVALRNMAYVGVNEKLDFEAPGKLGMKCYQYLNEDKLYDDE